ncbi:MAG TPA: hypothetical protein VII13_08320 [Vicinamibacteria bacterium]|jgi:hypothetical protein
MTALFSCAGGRLARPAPGQALIGREDGGALIVTPAREVWERSELTPAELVLWSFLVAAAGRAMLDALPQLESGCLNYWEAGNWALNDEAPPRGPKAVRAHRRVHLHLLGRSRSAADPSWRWGEAPRFPDFGARQAWTSGHARLEPRECRAVVERTEAALLTRYGLRRDQVEPWSDCVGCAYPTPAPDSRCAECRAAEAAAPPGPDPRPR